MQYGGLTNLISSLEYGTNIHICIVFLNFYGNTYTQLPFAQQIHQCAICDAAKSTAEGYNSCVRCRNIVLKLVTRKKIGFDGYCPKGIFEYCHPVIRDNAVAAVIFVGNILTDDPEQREMILKNIKDPPLQTMEKNFTPDQCRQTAILVENYIHFLMDRHGETTEAPINTLIENIKNYLQEILQYDFSMSDIASVFNYNEKYLGRLFKSKTGQTIKEYSNSLRIRRAKTLLRYGKLSVTDVANLSGYNNLTHFNRVFKKFTGHSPQEYKKSHKDSSDASANK